jgi:para-aminobenzoate synthetase component 1
MWNITATEKTISLPIDIASLVRQVKASMGIFLFNNRPSGTNIAGLNPVVVVKEESVRYGLHNMRIEEPLEAIDTIVAAQKGKGCNALLMGYIAYDYKARLEEPGLYTGLRQALFPDLYFALFEYYFFFRHPSPRLRLLQLTFPFPYEKLDGEEVVKNIGMPLAFTGKEKRSFYSGTSLPKALFEDAVRRTISYIRSGDIYQANITRSIYGETELDAVELGRRLYGSNRIDCGVFASIEGRYVISTSPERFFRIRNGTILTSPIKGTIEKIKEPHQNKKNKRILLTSEKNLAELAMIVDLLRNDISKFCRENTVRVSGFPILKELDNVYHLVSDIEGKLMSGVGFRDIIQAMFPGGSISGCPKIRACQIIEELEKEGRGIYTGSFGYLDFGGNMDFNIMIRSLFLDGNSFIFNVGGGITLLSEPCKEYEETIYKAKNIYDAINLEEVWEERYCLTDS